LWQGPTSPSRVSEQTISHVLHPAQNEYSGGDWTMRLPKVLVFSSIGVSLSVLPLLKNMKIANIYIDFTTQFE